MNYKETLEYIHSLGNFSMPATLSRISAVMEKLGNPQNEYKSIHIAGTNGKGSVSAMLASVFSEAGFKTGLFISPFIIDFRERIQINGEYISEKDLCFYAERIKELNIPLTEFEFITAVAFLYFKEKNIDILICETGLGGRLDATNVLNKKIATVITKIGLDHTAILGDTIEKIAAEKCGILRNCPTVTTAFQDEKALNVIKKSADKLYLPDLKYFETVGENTYIYKGKMYELSLKGDYQIENSLMVLETLNCIDCDIPYDTVYKAINNTFLPARMEKLGENPLIILDGAHNPDGAEVLVKELKKYKNVTAIVGMCRDKDCEEFLKKTLAYCENAVTVEIKSQPRSLSLEEIYSLASKYTQVYKANDYKTALKIAKEVSNGNPIFIFGSLYLAAGIREILIEK